MMKRLLFALTLTSCSLFAGSAIASECQHNGKMNYRQGNFYMDNAESTYQTYQNLLDEGFGDKALKEMAKENFRKAKHYYQRVPDCSEHYDDASRELSEISDYLQTY